MGRKSRRSLAQKRRYEKKELPSNVKETSTSTRRYEKKELPSNVKETSTSTIIQASYNQHNSRYSNASSGKQCVCNALMFHAYHSDRKDLQSFDLDRILDEGDIVYQNVIENFERQGMIAPDFLCTDDLPQTVYTRTEYSVVKGQPIFRLLSDIETGLNDCFANDETRALFIAGGYCIAIFIEENRTCGIFDSHARNEAGCSDPNGKAILMRFPNLQLLSAQLERLFTSLCIPRDLQYDLQPIKFIRKDGLNPENANDTTPRTTTVNAKTNKLNRCAKKKTYRRFRYNDKIHQVIKKNDRFNKIKKKCKNDVILRTKILHDARKRYASNLEQRLNKQQQMRTKYAEANVRREKKKQDQVRYQNNPSYREKKRKRDTEAYELNPVYRETQKKRMISAYHNKPEYREKLMKRIISAYRDDPDYREKQKKKMISAYRDDPDYREKQKKKIISAYRDDPDYREKQKKKIISAYRDDPDYREKQKNRIISAYHDDPEFRKQNKERYTSAYKNNSSFKVSERRRYFLNYRRNVNFQNLHKNRCALRIRRKYHVDRCFRNKKKQQAKHNRQQRKQKLINMDLVKTFRQKIKSGPTFVCTVCHRALFERQVQLCRHEKYNKTISDTFLTGDYVHECSRECAEICPRNKEHICTCCNSALLKRKMSSIASCNKLALLPIPVDLQGLNVLERHVIAKFIPFSKIIDLPKGKQRQIHGPVICVPAQVETTVQSLPRSANESQFLKVKLKRRLQYKGHFQYQTLNVNKVKKALKKLIEIHSEYSNIHIDNSPEVISQTNDARRNREDTDVESPEIISQTDDTQGYVEDTDVESLDESNNSVTNVENEVDQSQSEDSAQGPYLDTCIQPSDIGQEVLAYDNNVYCIAPAEGNKPASLFSIPKIEAMAFPVQFPDGKNTFDEDRELKLAPSRYFHSRLFNVDNRFAKDTNYIFFAQFVNEIYQAQSKISIQLRKGKPFRRDGRKIKSSMLKNKNEIQNMISKNEGTRFMEPLRGTPAYWERTMRDLFAMLRQLGTPTFFCTFSAAEMRWPEVITAIKSQQGESVIFDELDWMAKCEILRSNPVTTMRMFDHRVDLFLKNVILSAQNPIGEVIDYFFRVEFQQRGSPHIHCLFWIKDAPVFDKDTDEDVCEFVDQFITCELPSMHNDPELYKIVTEVQSHSKNHSKSCKKGKRECRFGFPKAPTKNTILTRSIDPDNEDETNNAKETLKKIWALMTDKDLVLSNLDDLLQKADVSYEDYVKAIKNIAKSTQIVMKRDLKDVWINGYNEVLLRAWNANMDIQYILNPYCCIMYIVSYITKSEKEMSAFLKAIASDCPEMDLPAMKKVMYGYSQNREISAQEAVTRTCGLKMKSSSRDVVFVPTDDNNVRLSLPSSVLEGRDDDSDDIWMTSRIDRYKARPNELENVFYAEFCSLYRIVYQKTKNSLCLQNNCKGYILKRTRGKPAVIRYARFSEQKDPEMFYCTLLKLYLPFRTERQLRTRGFPTYQSFYEGASVKLTNSTKVQKVSDIILENRETYDKYDNSIQDALQAYEECGENLEDAWSSLAPSNEVERIECEIERESVDNEENQEISSVPDLEPANSNTTSALPLIQVILPSSIDLRKMYQNMNEKQASEFYFVRDWCQQYAAGKEPRPFYHFITGGAGTGKSHLIKCIYAEATKILRTMPELVEESDISTPTVLLSAFTGTAAFNIQGNTLHSIFKINPRTKTGLGSELDKLRYQLGHLKILIIDEISMVGKQLFSCVEERLCQINGTKTKPFGGVSIIAVGDFQQLPPVRSGKPLCLSDSYSIDLWNKLFEITELSEIMRQRQDVEFAQLLNRLRYKSKKDMLDENDRMLLSEVTKSQEDCPIDALHIYSRNKDVNEHNTNILFKKFSNVLTLDANDYKKDPRSGKMKKCDNPFVGTNSDLKDCLLIAIGARVMLTRNIDVSDGLVNGSFGTVVEYRQSPKEIIFISFDSKDAGAKHKINIPGKSEMAVCIERHEEQLDNKRTISRRQFPMKLAYACTVHKVQGMTMTNAVVSLDHMFDSGMAYVALSRTTSLNGLHIVNFDEKGIYCNDAVKHATENMTPISFRKCRPLLTQISEHSTCTEDNRLTIVHHNTERLQSHIIDLKNHHELALADILCLTETFLKGQNLPECLNIPGYKLVHKNREESYNSEQNMILKDGGGIAIYIKESLQFEVIRDVGEVTDLEFLGIKIENQVDSIVMAMYRPPTYSIKNFIQNLKKLMNGIDVDVRNIIICGDFNEDLLSANNKPIFNYLTSLGYKQLIKEATTEKDSLLDPMYVLERNLSNVTAVGVIPTYYSYHDAVFCIVDQH